MSPQPVEAWAAAVVSPTATPAIDPSVMPDASPDSSHPVERAVARGVVLAQRLEFTADPGRWDRVLLLRTDLQPRLVRVVENWSRAEGAHVASCLRREMFLADQLILATPPGLAADALRAPLAAVGVSLGEPVAENLWTAGLATADLDAIPAALAALAGRPDLAVSAEPDGVGFGSGVPNDPYFSFQWGLHNSGQLGGLPGADVDAPELWTSVQSATDVIVAVLDSGLNFTHPDLEGIAWRNPGEIAGDGIDNDGNGKIDDVRGWDFVSSDNDPTDDHGHGSHVTGVIAANRDNGQGIAGLVRGARILSCKILNSSNSGFTSDLIAAVAYARRLGAPIMNLSLQNYPFSSSLDNEFNACRSAGVLLAICAGNQGVNNDLTPNYPSGHGQANIIAVGNHDRTDARWSGSFGPSNYGAASVDLFAPGRDIYSTVLGRSYESYTGTSMSTPHVTAVGAAIKYANPSWTAVQIKAAILGSVVVKAAYQGISVTGGRLNASAALARAFGGHAEGDSDRDGAANLLEYLAGTRIDSAASRPLPPTLRIVDGWLHLEMPHVPREKAFLRVEQSTDLVTWADAEVSSFDAEALRGAVSLSGRPRMFLRVVAESGE